MPISTSSRLKPPLAFPRSYTPRIEPLENWLAFAGLFGVARGVLVQPSVYGFDNGVLLAALSSHGDRLRGIAVIAPDTDDAELRRLDRLGVRGIRVNLRNKSGLGFDALACLAPRIRALGWHVQFQIGPEAIATVGELSARYGLAGVIDHLAFMSLVDPGGALDALQRALDTGRVYVKISAPYRLEDAPGHEGYRKTVALLANRYPARLLWGSDWPHTELFRTMPADSALIALSLAALPRETHAPIFVHNAETLYFSR